MSKSVAGVSRLSSSAQSDYNRVKLNSEDKIAVALLFCPFPIISVFPLRKERHMNDPNSSLPTSKIIAPWPVSICVGFNSVP